MNDQKCCAVQELHVEQMHGMLVFRHVGRRKIYNAQCAGCGRKFDLSQRQAIGAVKARAANHKGRHQ